MSTREYVIQNLLPKWGCCLRGHLFAMRPLEVGRTSVVCGAISVLRELAVPGKSFSQSHEQTPRGYVPEGKDTRGVVLYVL